LANRPQFGNSNFMLQGFMNNGQPVSMRASGWVNTHKDDQNNQQAQQAAEQVRQLVMQYNLSISVSVDAKVGDDPKTWPAIGKMSLFANKPREDQHMAAPALAANPFAAQAPAAPTAQPNPFAAPQPQDSIPF